MAARYGAFVPDVTWLVCPLHAAVVGWLLGNIDTSLSRSLFPFEFDGVEMRWDRTTPTIEIMATAQAPSIFSSEK